MIPGTSTMKSILLLLAASTWIAHSFPPPHPAVVAVRHEEEQLPSHLRKPALRNPHLQELLTLTSVLHQGEKPVFQREADSVSRKEIYNILTHAGFINRHHPSQHSHQLPQAYHAPAHFALNQQHFDAPYLSGPEKLQYL